MAQKSKHKWIFGNAREKRHDFPGKRSIVC
nr:MAG TPA: hypothetical protein [Caudoviricetes sp.]